MCESSVHPGGRAAHQSAEERRQALLLAQQGRVFDLDQEIHSGSPHFPRVQPPFLMSLWTSAERVIRKLRTQGITNDPGVNLEQAHLTFHVGTHIDALGHFTSGDSMYGGRKASNVVGDQGLRDLGAEHIPSLITRGLCLNMAGIDGGEFLSAGRPLGPSDLQAELDRMAVSIRPGDVVLIRTGWGRFYATDNSRYIGGEPGIDLDAARWLTEQGVYAIGADSMAVEVLPGTDPSLMMPVHQHCLVEQGVYLIENLQLDALAQENIYEFCFVLLPARFRGATGSPVRPIALI